MFLPVCVVVAGLLGLGSTACASNGSDPSPSASAITSGQPRLKTVANFNQPVDIKAAPGFPRLMFVVEQDGTVRVIRRGRKLSTPFLDIRSRVLSGGEQGLLSIAFPPDYRRSKRFYVYYTDGSGDIKVDEFRRKTPVRAAQGSRRPVITIRHRENSNHNGGRLQFLGNNLYFGTGDGGGGGDTDGNAQNLDVLLGKMIRIDPRASHGRPYSVPGSNPYVGRPGRDEIFAYGLRNPFRWSFIRQPGRTLFAIADVGQGDFEEINMLPFSSALGANFGWNRLEGFSEFNPPVPEGTRKPVLVLSHNHSYCSVIGGVVLRDRRVPALLGRYLFSDFCKPAIRSFKPQTGRVSGTSQTGISAQQITSFGESLHGTVYVTSLAGPVYKLVQ